MGDEPVGGIYLRERCTKTISGRSLVVERKIVKFETPTAFAFVVQLQAGVADQVDDRVCVEHRQL